MGIGTASEPVLQSASILTLVTGPSRSMRQSPMDLVLRTHSSLSIAASPKIARKSVSIPSALGFDLPTIDLVNCGLEDRATAMPLGGESWEIDL